MLTTPNQIALFRLKVILQGIKLEQLGMTKSGRSCTVIAKEMFGLPKATKREKVLEMVEKAIQNSKV